MAPARNILLTAMALAGAILFFGVSGTDIWIQSHFYNPENHRWIVDPENGVLKFIFYDGIKRLLIIISVILLFTLIIGWKKPWIKEHRRGLMIVVLSSIFVPVIVGGFKAATNMPCPKNLEIFGGDYPHTCVWEQYPTTMCQKAKIKCWPAGHASGGFALLSLIFLFRTSAAQKGAFAAAMIIGWSMGSYKMLIGDHFFSHTFITMVMAWLIILVIARGVDYAIEKKGIGL